MGAFLSPRQFFSSTVGAVKFSMTVPNVEMAENQYVYLHCYCRKYIKIEKFSCLNLKIYGKTLHDYLYFLYMF